MKTPSPNLLGWVQRASSWWGMFTLWAVAVTLGTCTPGRSLPVSPFPDFDKVIHFIAFLLGAVVLFPAIRLTAKWRLLPTGLVTFFLLSLFGILDEYKQLSVPGRQGGDWADIAANSLGAAAGVIMLWGIYGYSIGRRKKAQRLAPRGD